MRAWIIVGIVLLFAIPATAAEIAGVDMPDKVTGDDGVALVLNGAGIRTKFFFNIYIAALYLEHPSADGSAVIADNGRKRMVMHFLYDEVGKDKLVEGWEEGFAANTEAAMLSTLRPRLDAFNELFIDVKTGDEIVFDYLPEIGTRVTIKGEDRGQIDGKDFNDALLRVWLGEKPADKGLKKELLSFAR